MLAILAVLIAVVVKKFYFRRKNVQSSTKTRKNENKGTTTIGSQAAALGFKSVEINLIKKVGSKLEPRNFQVLLASKITRDVLSRSITKRLGRRNRELNVLQSILLKLKEMGGSPFRPRRS